MNGGWAVVIGALIALAGSTLIPWLREAISARRVQSEASEARRREAVVDLLAANAQLATATALGLESDSSTAFEARARAVARILIEATSEDRKALSAILDESTPVPRSGPAAMYTPRQRMLALQIVMTEWISGTASGKKLVTEYANAIRMSPLGESPAPDK